MNERRSFQKPAACGALLVTVLVWSCSPTQPTSTPPGAPPTVTFVEVQPPGSIAPGASVQLRATARMSDATTQDVSDRVQWRSGDASILQVTPAGLATGVQVGETTVDATYQADFPRYAVATALVLPSGTFKLSGQITEGGLPIVGVSVTVISGIGAGWSTTTGFNGSYKFLGVSGPVRLEAKRDGVLNQIEEVDVIRTMTHDFVMTPTSPRPDVTGAWTLTIDMGVCDRPFGGLPNELRRRQYNAVVTQQEARLTVTLSGADFIQNFDRGNRFTGRIGPVDQVMFTIGDPNDTYLMGPHDLVEGISASQAFVVHGRVDARATAATITGTLQGMLMVTHPSDPTSWWSTAECNSSAHAFEMRRQ